MVLQISDSIPTTFSTNQTALQPYWLEASSANVNLTSTNATNSISQTNLIRRFLNNTSRVPPPPYPGASTNTIVSGRSSAIQLPERNNATTLPANQQPNRPSGAATRIPQQSSTNYEEMPELRLVKTILLYKILLISFNIYLIFKL